MNAPWHLRVWPKSLYNQILLVAALALLIAQSINAWMLISGVRQQSVAEGASILVGRVANRWIRSNTAKEERLPDFARRGRQALALVETTAPPRVPGYRRLSELEERANAFLSSSDSELSDAHISYGPLAALPPEFEQGTMRRRQFDRLGRGKPPQPRDALVLSVKSEEGWLSAAIVIGPRNMGAVFAMLLQTLILYIAVMIPLALVARRIAKPLERLTERVQRVGLIDEIAPLESEGPSDVRQLVDAFNAMQGRVATLLGEKDVMLGAIGHDLKTPLSALRVRVESVEDDTERDKMVATIDEMVTILNDILMLARLGKSGEALQSVDIGALAESIAGEFENTRFISPEARLVAQVRPVLLRRALRNLISNAVAYGKSATVSLVKKPGALVVEIIDQGPGIAPSQMESMFEPFSRAEASRSRTTGGSGLGLTIARAIARSHGGDVALENREGGGLKASLSIATR